MLPHGKSNFQALMKWVPSGPWGVMPRKSIPSSWRTRFDQLGDRRLRRCVVTSDEDIERLTSHLPGDQRSGEGGYVGLGMKRGHMPALLALHVPW
jgi:hypothetical protein